MNEITNSWLLWTQNYFGDPWNVLDFVIVIGSIVDIIAGRLLVSPVGHVRIAAVALSTYRSASAWHMQVLDRYLARKCT